MDLYSASLWTHL